MKAYINKEESSIKSLHSSYVGIGLKAFYNLIL